MEFEYFKLNKKGQASKCYTLILDNFDAVLVTGHNWKLMRKKGRPLELYSMKTFEMFVDQQRMNNESVNRQTFTYIYDENGNKVRDAKGKLLREYTEPVDYLAKAIKLKYIKDKKLLEYAKEIGKLFYDDDPWKEILRNKRKEEKC